MLYGHYAGNNKSFPDFVREDVIMSVNVEYITYNNKDFKQIVPCDDMEDAEVIKELTHAV